MAARKDHGIGWGRASALTAAIVIAGIVVFAIVPNLIIVRPAAMARGLRAALATGWYVLALAGSAWAMRGLQRRGWI